MPFIAIALAAIALIATVAALTVRALQKPRRLELPDALEAEGQRLQLPTHSTDLGRSSQRDPMFDIEAERIRNQTAGGPG